jgi:N-acetylmuramoyl-L-alanine amidase
LRRRWLAGVVATLIATGALGLVSGPPVSAGSVTHRDASPARTEPPAEKFKPPIHLKRIPFGHARKMEMARYSKRHYGQKQYRLIHPRVIVEHFTDGPTMMSAWWTMADNSPNLGELPGVCAHFIIDGKGRIYSVVPVGLRCRHTIGLNQTAIGIEHVGFSDHQVMSDRRQRLSSQRLTLWLMARFNIPVKNVIGHGESLMSPYRYEKYKSWKCNTHTDFSHHTMIRYRHELRAKAKVRGIRTGPKPQWVDIGC